MPASALVLSLLGIGLGSNPAELRARLGDPLLVERLSDISRTADYLRADDTSAVLRVTERDGVIFAVEIERERPESARGSGDAYGVVLGMTRSEVEAKRGKPAIETVNTLVYPEDASEDASMIYRFDGDTVEGIKLVGSGTAAGGNPTATHLAETSGAGYNSAILDVSPTVAQSDRFRDRYLTLHGCDTTGRSSTVDRREGRRFSIVSATCKGKSRTLYFDITSARP